MFIGTTTASDLFLFSFSLNKVSFSLVLVHSRSGPLVLVLVHWLSRSCSRSRSGPLVQLSFWPLSFSPSFSFTIVLVHSRSGSLVLVLGSFPILVLVLVPEPLVLVLGPLVLVLAGLVGLSWLPGLHGLPGLPDCIVPDGWMMIQLAKIRRGWCGMATIGLP